MDISELRKKPHLSASGISDYLECGLRYRFSRIDRVTPEYIADALVFGSCIHRALEQFCQVKMNGDKIPLHDFLNHFEEHWKKSAKDNPTIRYKAGKNFNVLLTEGKSLLATYYHQLPEDDFQVLAIEEPFSFALDGIPLPIIGVIDLVEEDTSGTIIISDFKTSSKAYTADEVDSSLQLTLYGMAMKKNGYADREILLRFDCLIKTKIPKLEQYYTVRSDADEQRVVKKIYQVWRGISNGFFIPNDTSWKCAYCEYQRHCQEWFDT
jgi:putative RecB family exonuclease